MTDKKRAERRAARLEKRTARAMEMRDLRLQGASLESIGQKYGVSRERVRQILVEHYDTSFKGACARARYESRTARMNEYATEVLDRIRSGEPVNRRDVEREAPFFTRSITEVLGRRGRDLTPTRRTTGPRMNVDNAVAMVGRTWRAAGRPARFTMEIYDKYRDRASTLSGARLVQIFPWAALCAQAGVPYSAPKRAYAREWTYDEVVEWVVTFLIDSGGDFPLTMHEYDSWRRRTRVQGAPAGSTVITYSPDRTWSHVAAQAAQIAVKRGVLRVEPK